MPKHRCCNSTRDFFRLDGQEFPVDGVRKFALHFAEVKLCETGNMAMHVGGGQPRDAQGA